MSDPQPGPITVWQIYKGRFIYTQLFILAACGGVYLYRRDLPLALAMLVFLQFAGIYGAWMGKRMLDRIEESNRERGG